MLQFVLCVLVLASCVHASAHIEVSISAHEYCSGCIYTVESYATLTAEMFEKMQSQDIEAGESVNGNEIANLMCDSPFFSDYKNYVKYSCIKMLDEKRDQFLNGFAGTGSVDSAVSKKKVYERTRNICVDEVKACSPSMLMDRPVADKNQCSACETIAPDFYRAFQTHNATNKAGKRLPVVTALEKVCGHLGFYHQPYIWLEEYCDEVMDDYAEQIGDILRFRERVARTGMRPTTTVAEDICKELHPKCYEEDTKARKAKNDKKGKRESNKTPLADEV